MKISKAIPVLALSLSFLLLVVGCKKKKDDPKEETLPSISQPPLNPKKLNGYLNKDLTYLFRNDTLWENELFLSCAFFNTLISRDSILTTGTAVDAGKVSFNDTSLSTFIHNGGKYYNYYRWGGNTGNPPNRWKIYGTSDFSGFYYVDDVPEPTFSGIDGMIDTVWIGKKNVLKINGLKGADSAQVYIEGKYYCGYTSVPKTFAGTFNEVVFEDWETSNLVNCLGLSVDIVIRTYRNNFRKINGKILNFQSTIVFKVTVPAMF